ncbi:hypothetical protein [Persicobacter psychrovividus]|uniref:YD repeat-containing protein n=1 Tax=Persicobacter psychrovividus TaxID=387638 RepID=A0ABM7VBR9_9BACT|nr:hypothetical protein PEPS_06060 [Persicobacter psychrovividus]
MPKYWLLIFCGAFLFSCQSSPQDPQPDDAIDEPPKVDVPVDDEVSPIEPTCYLKTMKGGYSHSDEVNSISTYSYDENKRLISVVDQNLNPEYTTVETYIYNEKGQCIAMEYTGTEVEGKMGHTYTYDELGRLIKVYLDLKGEAVNSRVGRKLKDTFFKQFLGIAHQRQKQVNESNETITLVYQGDAKYPSQMIGSYDVEGESIIHTNDLVFENGNLVHFSDTYIDEDGQEVFREVICEYDDKPLILSQLPQGIISPNLQTAISAI